MRKTKLFITTLLIAVICLCTTGCSEAAVANANMSAQANEFGICRRVTVWNARTDNIIMYIEGYISISNNSDDELVVTAKVGDNCYKKNYVYLNDYTLYVVEDISGTYTDPHHYKIYFHTEVLLPDIEIIQ